MECHVNILKNFVFIKIFNFVYVFIYLFACMWIQVFAKAKSIGFHTSWSYRSLQEPSMLLNTESSLQPLQFFRYGIDSCIKPKPSPTIMGEKTDKKRMEVYSKESTQISIFFYLYFSKNCTLAWPKDKIHSMISISALKLLLFSIICVEAPGLQNQVLILFILLLSQKRRKDHREIR